MSVKYHAVPKGQPGVVGGGKIKYYASIIKESKVDQSMLLDEISKRGVAHRAIIVYVMEEIFTCVSNHLIDGRTIDLWQLGTFYPSISSTPMDTEKAVRRSNIKNFTAKFRPSIQLKRRMSQVSFEKEANDAAPGA
ncbi:MAG: hypothetical protein RLQ12_20240 [Cyclobacteriaceae bacterium]